MAIATAGFTATATACDSGCTSTRIQLTSSPAITSLTANVTLHARLLGNGKPLSGIRLTFYISVTGNKGEHVPAGTVDTDRNGDASLGLPNGVKGVLLPTDRATGYEAEFKSITDIDGTNYCNVTARRGFGS